MATLLDVTITAKRALEAVGRDHGVEVRIYLIAYADDVSSAIIIRYTEAELQLGIDAMMKEYEYIVFRRGRENQPLHVGGQDEGTHTKLLRVTVQKGYSFQKHATMLHATCRPSMLSELARVHGSTG